MKNSIVLLSILVLLLAVGWVTGLVGFRYPNIVQCDPLRHPVKVTDLKGTNMLIADGRVIAFRPSYESEFTNELRQSQFEVDIETRGTIGAAIYVRHNTRICGTPWNRLKPALQTTRRLSWH